MVKLTPFPLWGGTAQTEQAPWADSIGHWQSPQREQFLLKREQYPRNWKDYPTVPSKVCTLYITLNPVEKWDELLALQKGCRTWLSLQRAQSRAGLSPTATVVQLSQDSPQGWLVGTHVPDDLLQHRQPQSQPPTLSTKKLTASARKVPKDPPLFRASFYVFTTLSKTIHVPRKYC